MTSRTHRAPLTIHSPVPCCGQLPTELSEDDTITGTGVVTCLGVIAIPPRPTADGDLRALIEATYDGQSWIRFKRSPARRRIPADA